MFWVFLSGIYKQSIMLDHVRSFPVKSHLQAQLSDMIIWKHGVTGGGLSIDEGSFGSEWVTVCNLQGEEMDKLILRVGQLAHSTGVCL